MASSVQIAHGKCAVLAGSVLTLVVVSADERLVALCRDVLRELEATPGDLEVRATSEGIGNSEVCLWDYEAADESISLDDFENKKIFYLVPPSEVEPLLRSVPSAEGNILLKPVTRAVLRTFLGSVSSIKKSAVSNVVGTLRANRDELLQHLLHANLRLQEYDQQRTNFIARAVHDFRAPLTALSGYCGLLVSGQLGPLNDEQREALKRMEHSAKRITRMASAMFDLSIGSKINRKPELREGDIREPIKQALHEMLPLAREKRISLKADEIVPPDQALLFDACQIEQVLINLLDNGCKFTRRDGIIEVRGYPYFWERRFLAGGSAPEDRRVDRVQSPNSYRVEIEDTGPGIPPERLSGIFEEYTSYSGAQDRSGGGLGLAICRLIMSRHEGHIWAESQQGGAIFSFVLPYRRAEPAGNFPSPSSV